MMTRLMIRTAAAAIAIAAGSAASAVVVDFSGSMTGRGLLAPNAGCAPAPFQGQITGAPGSSVFGAFTYSHTTCTYGGPGPVTGNFVVDFGFDKFFGTLSGVATADAILGVGDLDWNYTITGGTGRFLGATGGFVGTGTGDTRVRPSIVSLSFSAVPEPATWAMMLLGCAGIGFALRKRKTVPPQLV